MTGALIASPVTMAGQTIYQLKDSNGTTVLTNKQGRYTALKVEKKTYYPDSNMHNYSHWGSNESSVLPSYSKNKDAFDGIIQHAANTHGVPAGLIKAVMHTESGFNVNARSPVGAQGLMQLMPATARRFNVSDAYDPQQNIMAGARYLAWLIKRFNGNMDFALAGYNAGEGNVDKYGGIPPFRETQDYVRRVNSRLQNLYSNASLSAGSSTSIPSNAKVIAKSANYQKPAPSAQIQYSTRPAREIIMTSEGSFTDTAATGTYSNSNAVASARIQFSE